MKNDELFEIIGDISGRHIEGAKKHKTVWKKWAAMAACLCVVIAAAFMITLRVPDGYKDGAEEPDHTHEDYISENGHLLQNYKTSETYGSLEELLLHLSGNDYHGRDLDSNEGASISSEGSDVVLGAEAAAFNGYVYHIADSGVEILNFDSEVKGYINCDATELFVSGDTLILKSGHTVGDELNYESYSAVSVYSLADPVNPALTYEYEQKGELVECYMAGDKLYLLTSDGVCACGYSRLSELSEYEPTLKINGEAASWNDWNDDDISILGEPVSVNYVAATVFDIDAGVITDKQAFYGDIDNVFFGDGWLAMSVQSVTEEVLTQPDIYTFDESLTYTGKLDLAGITEVDKEHRLNNDTLADGVYLTLTSVSKSGEFYRAVGTWTKIENGENVQELFVVTANIATGEAKHNQIYTENDVFSIDDIYWEDNMAIVCVSAFDLETAEYSNKFVIAEFDGMVINLYMRDFSTDPVNGVENYYAYGSPYGNIKTLIPLENGIYLRFNGVPNGFDIFDFSDPESYKLLYESEGEIAEDERFDFIWHRLADNVFGVMHMKMGEGEEIRETEFSYRIYRADPYQEDAFVLLNEYSFGKTDSFASSSVGLTVFEYEGEYYFMTQSSSAVTKLEW
ncbi:MAG: beta-propeller domain-containing protein [Oscillospiraceae bacterium]|nr:beta-propeller domain-containing protein [Oscillospiraceae bacterium]